LPESAEVKLSVDLIRPLLKDQILINLQPTENGRYNGANYPEGYLSFKEKLKINPIKILDIKCKGKFIYWILENDNYIFNTYGMTGQLSSIRGKHPCFEFQLANQSSIYFNDPRHFGTIKFVDNKQQLNKKLNELGWDILSEDLTLYQNKLISNIQRSNKCIGTLLLDQKLFGGSGNYIRAESLYLTKLSPWRLGYSLSKDEILNLCHHLTAVAQAAYDQQGASFSTFKSPFGQEGKYSTKFLIYKQLHDPEGNPIKRETTPEGRTIHWSPTIQK
jgi:DNA-formamidopyrimidine glycosylase